MTDPNAGSIRPSSDRTDSAERPGPVTDLEKLPVDGLRGEIGSISTGLAALPQHWLNSQVLSIPINGRYVEISQAAAL